jgi:putative nucleotidyltransferase with HDIG domain
MHTELTELIPEFNLFEDEELKLDTLNAYVDALEAGGWKPEDLKRMPFTLLINPCPASMLDHIRGVTRLAIAIADALELAHPDKPQMKANRDVLLAGALLHDVGKLVEYEEKDGKFVVSEAGKLLRHPLSGMGIARAAGLPEEVQHAVAYHSHEGDKSRATVEAIIINHADFLNFEPFKLG